MDDGQTESASSFPEDVESLVEDLVGYMDAHTPVEVWLVDSEESRFGFVVHVADDHVVLARVYQCSWHNGFVAVHFSLIDLVVDSADADFVRRCFTARGEAFPVAPPVTTRTFAALLAVVCKHFSIVVLTGHGEGALDVAGKIVRVSQDVVTLRPLSRSGYWEATDDVPLRRILNVHFGSRYEETLELVGRLPDAEQPDSPPK